MARSRVKYQYMSDASARKVTLKKRKANLFKKVGELTTLCDVEACLVMYENEDSPAEVWPSEPEARRLIEKFDQTTMLGPNTIQDHDDFLKKKIAQMTRQVEKVQEKISKDLMVKCLLDESAVREVKQEDVEGLKRVVDKEIKWIDFKISEACEKLKGKNGLSLVV